MINNIHHTVITIKEYSLLWATWAIHFLCCSALVFEAGKHSSAGAASCISCTNHFITSRMRQSLCGLSTEPVQFHTFFLMLVKLVMQTLAPGAVLSLVSGAGSKKPCIYRGGEVLMSIFFSCTSHFEALFALPVRSCRTENLQVKQNFSPLVNQGGVNSNGDHWQ